MQKRPKEIIGFPGAEVKEVMSYGICVLGTNLRSLQEQYVLLTADPSLQIP